MMPRRCRLGLSTGSETCEPAKFSYWSAAEIKRMPVRAILDPHSAAQAIAHVVGTDLTVKEHIIGIGLDQRGHIVSVANGSSHQKSVCMYRANELVANVYAPAPNKVKAIVVGHNHPSGYVEPSREDIQSMKALLCQFEGALFMDHVIVGFRDDQLRHHSMFGIDEKMFEQKCRRSPLP